MHFDLAQPSDAVVSKLLGFVFRFRRLNSSHDPCAETPCADCFASHWERTRDFIIKGEPVHFIIPAFPAKSRSAKKVLGPLPDFGERIAIWFLQAFCDHV